MKSVSDRQLRLAVLVNILLTVAQVAGGLIAGSLSLIADALHNLGDAGALGLAFVAHRIARRPADESRTFGYGRAEVIAAFVNLTTLILIGLYLIYEAVLRYLDPQPIVGWIVVAVAGVALAVDIGTALLTRTLAKESLNVRAAFLHNISDALASLGVIVAGTLILLYDLYIADAIVTILIAGYVLYQGFTSLPRVIAILMQSTPANVALLDVVASMEGVAGVRDVYHVHLWEIDERNVSLEAHVLVDSADFQEVGRIKVALKDCLKREYGIGHSTLEFEFASDSPSVCETEGGCCQTN